MIAGVSFDLKLTKNKKIRVKKLNLDFIATRIILIDDSIARLYLFYIYADRK